MGKLEDALTKISPFNYMPSPKWEVLARLALMYILAYMLSIAYMPWMVPPSTRNIIGIATGIIAMALPQLMMITFLVGPFVIIVILIGLAIATTLLAAVTVHTAFMVALFAVFALWLSTLRYGKHAAITAGMMGLCLLISEANTLSLYQLVQDGITVKVTESPDDGDDGSDGYILELIRQALEQWCVSNGQPTNCYQDQLPDSVDGVIKYEIPSGNFEGQTVYIYKAADGTGIELHLDGGMWLVTGFWKWTGITNSLAAYWNLIIAFCWFVAVVCVSISIPPFHTMRGTLTRMLIPMGLKNSIASVRAVLTHDEENNKMDNDETDEEAGTDEYENDGADNNGIEMQVTEEEEERDSALPVQEQQQPEGAQPAAADDKPIDPEKADALEDPEKAAKERAARLGALVHLTSQFAGGTMAMMTAYEYRVLRAPFECTFPLLKELMLATQSLMIKAVVLDSIASHEEDRDDGVGRVQVLESEVGETLDGLDRCLKALGGDEDAGDELLALLPSHEKEAHDNKGVAQEKASALKEIGKQFGMKAEAKKDSLLHKKKDHGAGPAPTGTWHVTDRFNQTSHRVIKATGNWLNAMHHPKQGCKAALISVILTFGPGLLFVKSMVDHFIMAFHWKTYKKTIFKPRDYWDKAMHCVKFTAGFMALVCMTVYWDDFRNYAIETGYPNTGEVYPPDKFVNETPASPNLYSGWLIIAYIFSTQPTTEASVKKGLLRACGTCLGAFVSWFGLLVCSGFDYDGNGANINPYGLCAWLWFFSLFPGSYFIIDDGPTARMGMNKDHGWWAMYFNLTLVLTALNVFSASDQRDEIITNRLVANLTGIAMSMVIALFPPQLWGGDPNRALDILSDERKYLAEALKAVLDCKEDRDANGEDRGRAAELEALHDDYLALFTPKRKDTMYLIKNATRLARFPRFFKVDPRLMVQMDRLSVVGNVVGSILVFARYIDEQDEVRALFAAEGGSHRLAVERALEKLQLDGENQKSVSGGNGGNGSLNKEGNDEADVFVTMVEQVISTLGGIENVLLDIKW